MPCYVWLLIGLFGGVTAGLFLACLLHCSKEADQRPTLLKRVERTGLRNLTLQEHPKKYGRAEVGA